MADLSPVQFQNKLLQWILPLLTSENLAALLDFLRTVRGQLRRGWLEGMCEILEYDSVLELKDERGEVAILQRRQKVRFLQNDIIAYEDQAWGDGDIFADYKCSPGVAVDRYQDGYKWKVLISLRETKQRGDVTEFFLRRKILGGFIRATEWMQTELNHRAHRLRMVIIFPRKRPCQHAVVIQRNQNRAIELGPSAFSWLADGRQRLCWETNRPGINELYTIRWRW